MKDIFLALIWMTGRCIAEPNTTTLNKERKAKAQKTHLFIYLPTYQSIYLSECRLRQCYWMILSEDSRAGQWDIVWTHAGSVCGRVQTHVMRDWWIQINPFHCLNQPTTTNSKAFLPLLVDRNICPKVALFTLSVYLLQYAENRVKADIMLM